MARLPRLFQTRSCIPNKKAADTLVLKIIFDGFMVYIDNGMLCVPNRIAPGGRMMRWCWVSFQCRWRPTNSDNSRARPTAPAVSAGGGCLDVFFLSSIISLFFLSFSEDGPI